MKLNRELLDTVWLCPLRSANWNNGTNAGVWNLNLNNNRTNSNNNVSARS